MIAIYQYPSLSLYRILREGTEQLYSHLDYNPDGSLLASICGNPDYYANSLGLEEREYCIEE